MKTASLEEKLEDMQIKGRVRLPAFPAFSASMIATILNEECPMTAPCLRTVQRAISDLKKLPVELTGYQIGNTPYYDRISTEMILVELKFKVKVND
jgi:hypothetical protein